MFCTLATTVTFAEESFNPVVPTEAKLEYNKGIDYYNSGQFDEAIKCFEKAIDLDSDYIDAYYNLGMTFDALKQYEASQTMFDELLARKPDDYGALYRAAMVSYKLNLPTKAKSYLAKLPESSPYYYKGEMLAKAMGTNIKAIKEANPEDTRIEEKSKTSTTGKTFAGNFYYEDLPSPTGIAVDEVGYLYVADYSDNTIFRITPTGEKIVYLKSPQIDGPIGLALDSSENLYIANYNNNTVLKLSSSHVLTTLINDIEKPYYLYVKDGYLFVSSQGTNSVVRYKI